MSDKHYLSPEIGYIQIAVEQGFAGSGFGEFHFPGQMPEEEDYGNFDF